eukprot:1958306-Rhodomonas_salina.2
MTSSLSQSGRFGWHSRSEFGAFESSLLPGPIIIMQTNQLMHKCLCQRTACVWAGDQAPFYAPGNSGSSKQTGW